MQDTTFHTTTRRTAIKSLAAIFGVTGTGLGAYALTAEPAVAAEVIISSLGVADYSIRESDGKVTSIWARVTGSWQFTSKTDVEPTGVRLDLSVSPDPGTNFDRIARRDYPTSGFDANGSYQLLGEVTSHLDLPPSTFNAPDAGTQTQTQVHVRVTFSVMDGDAVLGKAAAEDTAVVTVENSSIALSVGIDGQGQFEVQANSTDPTPTLTG